MEPIDLESDSRSSKQRFNLPSAILDLATALAIPGSRKPTNNSLLNLDEEKLKFQLEERTSETPTDFQKRMHNRKVMRGTMGLNQLREWKKTLGKEEEIIGKTVVSEPAKRKREVPSAKNVDQYLKDMRLLNQRKEAELSKRRRFLEQKQAEQLRQTDVSLPGPMEISKEDQRRMEMQIRFQNRFQLDGFYSFVLSLDVYNLGGKAQCPGIPTSFQDGLDYAQAFTPAFFEEVRADLENCVKQADFSKAPKVMLQVHHEANGFSYLICNNDTSEKRVNLSMQFRQDDIVLCVLDTGDPLPFKISPGNRFHSPYFLGVCEQESGTSKISSGFYLKTNITEELRNIAQTPRTYFVVFLEYAQTMIREYRMIHFAEFLELSQLLAPKPPDVYSIPARIPNVSKFQPALNSSQLEALAASLIPYPAFTLIQGPPGTGKTHTLLCILSMYLQRTDCPKPILVCAPSNAAIDEIVARTVRDGIMGFNGSRRTDLRMLRVGNQKKDQTELKQRSPSDKSEQRPEVTSISLQHLVSQKLRDQGLQDEHTTLATLRDRLEKIESDLSKTEENEQVCARLRQERKEAITALNREKCSKALFEDKKRTAELELLQTVDIVFTTLSGAASKCLEKLDRRFELVVIDEACQTVELTALIPLQYKARKVIMIGDPMQLPATTFSEAATKAGYSRSLFERLAGKGIPVITLKDQYRMVPEIREFPSSAFYNGVLTDGNQTRAYPVWRPAPSLLFIDLKTSAEVRDEEGTSVANVHESTFITELYRHFSRFHGTGLNIGVITPYRRQVSSIKACLQYKFGSKWQKDIEVNTVDGFQGREKDVIVFSAVRSREQIGFLSDVRRLNVAVTRAKFALWVVGRAETLQRHKVWAQFLAHCEDRGRLLHASSFADVDGVFERVV